MRISCIHPLHNALRKLHYHNLSPSEPIPASARVIKMRRAQIMLLHSMELPVQNTRASRPTRMESSARTEGVGRKFDRNVSASRIFPNRTKVKSLYIRHHS